MTLKTRDSLQDVAIAFEPDALLPEQFYATLRRNDYSDPEKRLIAAVLEDAVACLSVDPTSCSRRQQRDFVDAQAWVLGKGDSDCIFSFVNVCEILGIDPSYLRKGLDHWSPHHRINANEARRSRRRRGAMRRKQIRLRASF